MKRHGPTATLGRTVGPVSEAGVPGLQAADVVIDFLFRRLLRVPVALLEFADERVALAADQRPVVIGQLGPLRLEAGRELLPLALDLIPVHRLLPSGCQSPSSPSVRPSATMAVPRTGLC